MRRILPPSRSSRVATSPSHAGIRWRGPSPPRAHGAVRRRRPVPHVGVATPPPGRRVKVWRPAPPAGRWSGHEVAPPWPHAGRPHPLRPHAWGAHTWSPSPHARRARVWRGRPPIGGLLLPLRIVPRQVPALPPSSSSSSHAPLLHHSSPHHHASIAPLHVHPPLRPPLRGWWWGKADLLLLRNEIPKVIVRHPRHVFGCCAASLLLPPLSLPAPGPRLLGFLSRRTRNPRGSVYSGRQPLLWSRDHHNFVIENGGSRRRWPEEEAAAGPPPYPRTRQARQDAVPPQQHPGILPLGPVSSPFLSCSSGSKRFSIWR